MQHILLIGKYNTDAYNSVIWSLVHEMRISIVFPLVLMICLRKTVPLSIALIMSFILATISYVFVEKFVFRVGKYVTRRTDIE